MTPLYVVTKSMAHHRRHAGYNRLLDHVDADQTVWARTGPHWRALGAATRRFWRPLTGVAWYGAPSLAAELELRMRIGRRPAGVVHVMYGEDLLYLWPRIKGPHRVVATFHQPRDRFDQLIDSPATWSRLDGVIVLDDNNADVWRGRIDPSRVYRATLGVDTQYWHPAESSNATRCLTVGNHLRDFDLLSAVVERCPTVGFDLVIPTREHARFQRLENAACHADVSDDGLAQLYRDAALLILPLRGGSASNTVLQALASGLPIVTTNFAGATTYLDDRCSVRVESGDVAAATSALRSVLGDPDKQNAMATAARKRAAEFDWARVAERHRAIYAAVHAAEPR